MANEIVKYHSELNTIPFRNFSKVEMDILFSIISRVREKHTQVVRLTFSQLRDLSRYKATANLRFMADLHKTYEKILGLKFGRTSKNGMNSQMFVLFNEFNIVGEPDDDSEPYVDVQVYPKAIDLLNDVKRWVRYSLLDFTEIRSSYAKAMFRLLKQWRTVGEKTFSLDDLFELLDIPDSYRHSTTNLNKRVITPIKQELSPFFEDLEVKSVYSRRRGHALIGYKFKFKPEAKNADDFMYDENERENDKLSRVSKNNNLSEEDKYIAVDKAKGLPLGTTKKNQEQMMISGKMLLELAKTMLKQNDDSND